MPGITTKRKGVCVGCSASIPKGAEAWFERSRGLMCLWCYSTPAVSTWRPNDIAAPCWWCGEPVGKQEGRLEVVEALVDGVFVKSYRVRCLIGCG